MIGPDSSEKLASALRVSIARLTPRPDPNGPPASKGMERLSVMRVFAADLVLIIDVCEWQVM